jgi:hypothetical protein
MLQVPVQALRSGILGIPNKIDKFSQVSRIGGDRIIGEPFFKAAEVQKRRDTARQALPVSLRLSGHRANDTISA